MLGKITIKPGLTGQDLVETVRHETVHSFLSPRNGPFRDLRASLKAWGYENSHLLRYTEEAAAETFATGSLRTGLAFPLQAGYDIVKTQLALEGAAYVGGTAGLGYGSYQLSLKVFQEKQ